MKSEIISTRIEPNMKVQFIEICDEMGLSPSQAIKLFAKAVINTGGIPFELRAKQPNKLTIQAMQELDSGGGIKVSNATELFKALQINLDDA